MNAVQHQVKQIGQLLLHEGLISEHELENALAHQQAHGGKLVSLLIELGSLTRRSFVDFLGRQGIAAIDLDHYRIDQEVLALIPRTFALELEIIPIDQLGKLLTIAMVCPLDTATIEKIEEFTGLRVTPLLCSAGSLDRAIARYYSEDDLRDEEQDTHSAGFSQPTRSNDDNEGELLNIEAIKEGWVGGWKNENEEPARITPCDTICPACQRRTPGRRHGFSFCGHCGVQLAITCPSCNATESRTDARFCRCCGESFTDQALSHMHRTTHKQETTLKAFEI